jgi:hypothetical protein
VPPKKLPRNLSTLFQFKYAMLAHTTTRFYEYRSYLTFFGGPTIILDPASLSLFLNPPSLCKVFSERWLPFLAGGMSMQPQSSLIEPLSGELV